MIEENVISPAGAHHKATEMMLRDVIISEGFTPIKRRADYVRLDPSSKTARVIVVPSCSALC